MGLGQEKFLETEQHKSWTALRGWSPAFPEGNGIVLALGE
jgi:hypothetical protein